MMKKWMLPMVMALCAVFLSGCATDVPQGHVGRVKTRSGWTNEILPTGRHTCFGFDTMYLMDITNVTFKEHLNILVGGKVNLKVDYSVRVKANTEDANMVREAFENIVADATYKITVEQLYMTYLQMKAQAIPRQVYEVQPDISTAIANSPQLAMEVRKAMTEAARSTSTLLSRSSPARRSISCGTRSASWARLPWAPITASFSTRSQLTRIRSSRWSVMRT